MPQVGSRNNPPPIGADGTPQADLATGPVSGRGSKPDLLPRRRQDWFAPTAEVFLRCGADSSWTTVIAADRPEARPGMDAGLAAVSLRLLRRAQCRASCDPRRKKTRPPLSSRPRRACSGLLETEVASCPRQRWR